jgi:hypothetical protein
MEPVAPRLGDPLLDLLEGHVAIASGGWFARYGRESSSHGAAKDVSLAMAGEIGESYTFGRRPGAGDRFSAVVCALGRFDTSSREKHPAKRNAAQSSTTLGRLNERREFAGCPRSWPRRSNTRWAAARS